MRLIEIDYANINCIIIIKYWFSRIKNNDVFIQQSAHTLCKLDSSSAHMCA